MSDTPNAPAQEEVRELLERARQCVQTTDPHSVMGDRSPSIRLMKELIACLESLSSARASDIGVTSHQTTVLCAYPSEVAKARLDALEEAAKMCEAHAEGFNEERVSSFGDGAYSAARSCAAVIRALSTQSNYAATQEIPAQASGFVRGPPSETPVIAAPLAQTSTPLTDEQAILTNAGVTLQYVPADFARRLEVALRQATGALKPFAANERAEAAAILNCELAHKIR